MSVRSSQSSYDDNQPGCFATWWNPQPIVNKHIENGTFVRGEKVLDASFGVLNTVVKVFATLASLIPGSSSKLVKGYIKIDKWANEGFNNDLSAQYILTDLFLAVAVSVNPYAKMKEDISKTNCWVNGIFKKAFENAKAGIEFEGRYDKIPRRTAESGIKEWLQRNVVSRILFATWTVAVVVEKIVHLALGLLYTGCAAVKLFRDEKANDIARQHLGALDLFDEFSVGVRATLYPWQNLGKDRDLSAYRDPMSARDSSLI